MDEKTQKVFFKTAGIRMPKDKWLRLVALFGIVHISVNLHWNGKLKIKEWWNETSYSKTLRL